MNFSVFLLFVLLHCTLQYKTLDNDAKEDRTIKYLNKQPNLTWTAGTNFAKGPVNEPVKQKNTKLTSTRDLGIPNTFDARVKWPGCPMISDIPDEGECNSNWAVAAVAAMSDRICIHSDSQIKVSLSAADLLACCRFCGLGEPSCEVGVAVLAWEYWSVVGIVTGGEYGSSEGCKPYPFPPCQHDSNDKCTGTRNVPECTGKCRDGYPTPYQQDKHYGSEVYLVPNNVLAIQQEIMTNGPVQSSILLYTDLLAYRSGVYQHSAGTLMEETHGVKIIGWGVEGVAPYWLVANTWNPTWGDGGYFKIYRGSNECGIEGNVIAGIPKI